MATILKGNDLVLYIVIGGVNTAVCHTKDTKLTIEADIQETTTKDGGNSKRYEYQGKGGFSLTCNGLTNYLDVANFSYFQDVVLNRQKIPFVFTDNEDTTYTGTVLVPSIDIDSPDNAISSFNTTLIGDGPLVKDNSPIPIPTNIVQIVNQFGDVKALVEAPGSYSVLEFDTIDQRGWVSPDLIIIAGE